MSRCQANLKGNGSPQTKALALVGPYLSSESRGIETKAHVADNNWWAGQYGKVRTNALNFAWIKRTVSAALSARITVPNNNLLFEKRNTLILLIINCVAWFQL